MKRPAANFSKKHRRFRRGLLAGAVSLYLLLPDCGFALDPAKSVFQFHCQNWTRQNGLPADKINTIAQTKDGYIWLGTQTGLVRFNGLEFQVVPIDLPKAQGQDVRKLITSKDGEIRFAINRGGFGSYDGKIFSAIGDDRWSRPDMGAATIWEARDGTVWTGADLGLGCWVKGKLQESFFDEPTIGVVQSFCEDPAGRIWVGTAEHGLFYWADGKVVQFPDDLLKKQIIFALAADAENQIWVGTEHGLRCYSRGQPKAIPPLDAEVKALLVDRHGILWAGTSGMGLARYQNGMFTYLRKADGLGSDYVNSLFEDAEGSLWVGTRDGLSQLTDIKFPIYSSKEGICEGSSHSVFASARGGLWITTDTGASYFDGKTATNYTQKTLLTNPYVKLGFEARNGDVYLVDGDKNIDVLSEGRLSARYANQNWPTAFAEDSESVLVAVGTGQPLCRIQAGRLRPYDYKDGLQPDYYWINNLCIAKDGAIWAASKNGIFRVKDGHFKQWSVQDGLPDANVLCICQDVDGTIWAGSAKGITRIKDDKLKNIKPEQGLHEQAIYAIVPDDHGAFWLSSGRGIIRTDRRSLNDFIDGKTNQLRYKVFDGLESVKSTDRTDQENSGCKTLDGRIWFPSPWGVVMIDPAEIPTNQIAPPVHIDRVLVNGHEMARSEPIVIPPGKGEVKFDFTALSFIAPQKVRCRYQLEGYDKDWVETRDQRAVFYTNLKPGSYTFHMIAANADGVWNQTGDTLKIKLLPHFYQTFWFYALCGVSMCFVLAGIYAWRVRHLRRTQQILQAEVLNRTAELAKTNTSLHHEIEERKNTEVQLKQKTRLLENQIEERKRLEADLNRERDLWRTLLDNSPDHIYFKDTQSRFIKSSKAQGRQFGVKSPDEMVGKTDFDFFTEANARPAFEDEQEIIRTGQPIIAKEEREVWKDGHVTWASSTKMPMLDGTGKIIGIMGISRDITQRKRVEEALAVERNLLRAVIDLLPDCIYAKDTQHRFLLSNEACALLMGAAAPAELIGKTDADFYPSKLEANFHADELAVLKGVPLINKEEPATRPDGTREFILTTKLPLKDGSGKIIGLVGCGRNITDYKRAEAALAAEQARFKFIFDSVPLGISLVMNKPDGKLTRLINDAHLRVCGITREQADIRENFFRISHPDDRARQAELSRQVVEGKINQFSMEKRYLRLDGSIVWVAFSYERRKYPDGSFEELSTVVDITALKKAQEEAAYERDLLRALLENSSDNIYFKDAQSRFIKTSKAQAIQFGVASSNEMVGKSDFDFFTDEHARPAFDDELEIIRTGRPLIGKMEKEVLKDGRVSWALTNKMPLRNKDGEIIGTFGISKDITVIKETEAQLEQMHRQLLETSRQAGMAEIATNVLHNIGNVLNSVNVSASLVVDNVKKCKIASLAKVAAMLREHEHDLGTFITTDAKGRQLPVYLGQLSEQLLADQKAAVHELDLLVKNIEHIKEVVTMQQSYARVSGVKEIINIRELVEDGLRLNAGALARHRVEVIREFENVPPMNIDKHRVLQILVNLIRNAKYACDESGRADRRMTVRVANGEGRIKISVSDNGIGILPENLIRIFNHGFTTRKDGHGFGLHSGALAAKEMGGSLAVQSDGIGKGARFTLELPCNRNEDSNE